MKRKIANPNPQEKKIRQLEEKIYDSEIKEEEEGMVAVSQEKANYQKKKPCCRCKGKM